MSNGKVIIILLIVGSIMSQYFPKPYRSFGGNVKVELDLSKLCNKSRIKKCNRAAKSDFACLKILT